MFSNYKFIAFYSLILVTSFSSHSNDADGVSLDFNGFANLGVTYSDSANLRFRNAILNKGRQGLSLQPDSLLGLQAQAKFNDRFDAVGQIILQDRYDDHLSNYIELAFLRYQANRNLFVKMGRFSNNLYLFTDSRYVSQAQNWVRTPISMYSAASVVGNMDGIQIGYITDTGYGQLKTTAAYGKNQFNNDRSGEFTMTYDKLQSYNIELSSLDWRFQVAHIKSTLQNLYFTGIENLSTLVASVPPILVPFAQELETNIFADGKKIDYTSAGIQYSLGDYEFIAEYGHYRSDWRLAQSSSFAYLSAARNFGEYTGYVVIGEVDRKAYPQVINYNSAEQSLPAPVFAQLAQITANTNEAVRSNSFDQRSISVGIRWDFKVRWALKVQFDHNRTSPSGSGLFMLPPDSLAPVTKESLNVFNVSLTTNF